MCYINLIQNILYYCVFSLRFLPFSLPPTIFSQPPLHFSLPAPHFSLPTLLYPNWTRSLLRLYIHPSSCMNVLWSWPIPAHPPTPTLSHPASHPTPTWPPHQAPRIFLGRKWLTNRRKRKRCRQNPWRSWYDVHRRRWKLQKLKKTSEAEQPQEDA